MQTDGQTDTGGHRGSCGQGRAGQRWGSPHPCPWGPAPSPTLYRLSCAPDDQGHSCGMVALSSWQPGTLRGLSSGALLTALPVPATGLPLRAPEGPSPGVSSASHSWGHSPTGSMSSLLDIKSSVLRQVQTRPSFRRRPEGEPGEPSARAWWVPSCTCSTGDAPGRGCRCLSAGLC